MYMYIINYRSFILKSVGFFFRFFSSLFICCLCFHCLSVIFKTVCFIFMLDISKIEIW